MSLSTAPIDSQISAEAVQEAPDKNSAVDWLAWLATLLVDAKSILSLDLHSKEFAQWPNTLEVPDGALQLGLRAHTDNEVIRARVSENSAQVLLAIPLKKSRFDSSTVLLISCMKVSSERQKRLVHLVRWASEYRPRLSGPNTEKPLAAGIFENPESLSDQYLTILQGSDLDFSWLRLVNIVCRGTSVNRVVLASVDQMSANIDAISEQSQIDHRRELIRELQQAMWVVHNEGIPSFSSLNPAENEPGNVSIKPEFLILRDRSWLMLPITVRGKRFVILLERSLNQNFSVVESEEIARQLKPLLAAAQMHQDANGSLLTQLRKKLLGGYESLRRSKYRTIAQGLMLFALVVLLVVPVEHRISATAVINADDSHVLVVPIDGIVQSVHVSAGDVVTKDQLLASFDDSELELQAQQWRAEKQKNIQEYNLALATRDRIELSRLRADVLRIEAQIEMVRQQQERFQIRAPIDGVVLSGQWDDSLGAALKSGEKLFEVGTLDDYRLVLSVPERSIDLVKPAQSIALRMAANPGQKISAMVKSVSPVAIARQGVNKIKVFANLGSRDSDLRPGMQGVAQILVGRKSRASQWMAGFQSRLIIWAWKLGLVK